MGNGGKPVLVMKPINPKGLDTYRNNLEQMNTLFKNNGVPSYFIQQPTLFMLRQHLKERHKRSIEISMVYHAFGYQEHLDAFQKIYQFNKEVLGEDSIFDATGMSGRKKFFFDHIHQSPVGTKALAEIILAKISKDI